MIKLSIVIAVYNESRPLEILVDRIIKSTTSFHDYEIILVDDRSQDDSWQIIKQLCSKNLKIKGIRFTRNFGQHSALTAGIENSNGDYIVLMDCDQQDEPENIQLMFEKLIEDDVQIVYALRINRKDSIFKLLASKSINFILEKLSGYNHDHRIGTFRIFTKNVKIAFQMLPEKKRYIAGIFYWLGFKYSFKEVEHQARMNGKSSYIIGKQLKLARLGILSSSTKLLSLSTYLGLFSSLISLIVAFYYVYIKLYFDVPLGYSSLIVSILFVGSIILIVLGIIGEYLREMIDEIKSRPNHIIQNKINF
jgi:glycosyltransferase involved in cell wall biosynthesis